MATPERMLLQIAIRSAQQVDVVVLRLEECGRSIFVRERPHDKYFPTNLDGFGYHFHDGKLLDKTTGKPFVFDALSKNKDYNQRRYDALGEIITDIVYEWLEKDFQMERIPVPKDSQKGPRSFIFVSPGALKKRDKLMVLIHDNGVVRAGQWSRRLIINDCVASGTQLPFIVQAIQDGYEVVVLNTNRSYVDFQGDRSYIEGSATPIQHGCTVWRDYIQTSPARRIDIVAHCHGAVVAVRMMRKFFEDFRQRVHKIAFIDSNHVMLVDTDPVKNQWMNDHCRNWIAHEDPLDTVVQTIDDVPTFSAGIRDHSLTPTAAFRSIFAYFKATATT